MKATTIYRNLLTEAKRVEDKENTRLYVSDTVSTYIRNEIKKIIRKELENTLIDKELEVITAEEAEKEMITARMIYRSL